MVSVGFDTRRRLTVSAMSRPRPWRSLYDTNTDKDHRPIRLHINVHFRSPSPLTTPISGSRMSAATATMTDPNSSSMTKYYASKIGELSEVSPSSMKRPSL
jgi:hypothetical protein